MTDSGTTVDRPDQWYRDALARKWKTEACMLIAAQLFRPAAILLAIVLLAVIAWKI